MADESNPRPGDEPDSDATIRGPVRPRPEPDADATLRAAPPAKKATEPDPDATVRGLPAPGKAKPAAAPKFEAAADLDATIRGLGAGQKVFNRYTLKSILGQGGMGVVWLASDSSLETTIALKFLPEVVSLDEIALMELKSETRRSRELTHPNIVRIHDLAEDGHRSAIAMEYVDGANLAKRRTEQPNGVFTPEALLPWIGQLADALDYAHNRARVVHRDIKPANLMVNSRGELKVADFGISATLTDSSTRLSKTMGGSSGSPPYMSPQQIMGDKPAVTDDVYALGATLYELLTGKPPFHAGNILAQVQSKRPPSVVVRRAELLGTEVDATLPKISPAWEKTIEACLEKDPDDRPQSVGEVFRRLVGHPTPPAPLPVIEVVAATSPAAPPPPPARSRAGLWIALGVAAAALAFAAWLTFRPSSPATPSQPKTAATNSAVTPPTPVATNTPKPTDAPAPVAPVPSSPNPVGRATPTPQPAEPTPAPTTPVVTAPTPTIAPAPPLEKRLFVVVVTPVVPETRVWLGPKVNVLVENGRLELQDLPSGKYELAVQAPGHKASVTEVVISDTGNGNAVITLSPIMGTLSLTARPDTTVTAVDQTGREIPLGRVPSGGELISESVLPADSYTFRLSHPECPTTELTGDVRADKTLRIGKVQDLLPATLQIDTQPSGANVRLNGTELGKTPLKLPNLPAGQALELEFQLPGKKPSHATFTLRPGETLIAPAVTMIAEAGTLRLSVTPAPLPPGELVVTANGTRLSLVGGVVKDVPAGRPNVSVTHPDFDSWNGDITLRDGETVTIDIPLHPKPGTLVVETKPAGASVRIRPAPGTPSPLPPMPPEQAAPCRIPLPPGSYVVKMELVGYAPTEKTIQIDANHDKFITAGLEPLKTPVGSKPFTIEGLGLEMLPISPGTFTMGANDGLPDERPTTIVTITKAYWIGKTEVTQTQWIALMGKNPSSFRNADGPVEQVSWTDAMEFCKKLTDRESTAGRLPPGLSYTLPTEAQWEYACRAGSTGDFAATGDINAIGWHSGNSKGHSQSVATKAANAWGLYDMHGNVQEWCADWYGPYPGGTISDPRGPATEAFRVYRGGSWNLIQSFSRASRRQRNDVNMRVQSVGFRVALRSVQ